MSNIKIGILDRLRSIGYSDQSKAIREVLTTIQLAEHLGYERYWLTEHHSGLVDSSPEILLPLMAATTQHIKVGTAGILLPYYPSYKVAKTFHALSTMFPGRVDLGICRGKLHSQQHKLMTGKDDDGTDVGNFEEQAAQLNTLLAEAYHGDVASRGDASIPQQWIVGGGPRSMALAARLGASYCYSLCHKGNGYAPDLLADYTKEVGFRYWPGGAPESAILVAGVCGRTQAEAADLIAQHINPYIIPTVYGEPDDCAGRIHELADKYETTRVIWWDLCPSQEQVVQSLTLLSQAMGLRA